MTTPQQIRQTTKWQLTEWWQRQREKKRTTQPSFRHLSRNLLLRLIIGGTTLVVSTCAYYSHQVVRSLILENLKQNAFLQVQKGGEEIDGWLATRLAEIEALANTPTVRTMDWLVIDPYLKSEVTRLHAYTHLTLANSDGSYYTTKVGRASLNQNLGNRPHFHQAMRGISVIADPVISRTTGIPMIPFCAPIWAEPISSVPTKAIGVMIGNISTDRVTQVVNSLQYGFGSYAFALNSKGEPIVHPDRSLMGTVDKPAPNFLEAKDSSLQAIAQKMVNKQRRIELAQINGKWVYIAYLPLRQANWSVALAIPRENIESQLRPLDLIALVVLGLAVAIIAVLWQVQSLEQAQLKKSKEAADAANKAKSEFLANMSHELRTPLNGILGYAQILNRAKIGEKERHGIDIIYQCGSHLLTLINDILDLSKIEARKLDLHPTALHFPSFLQSVVEISRIRAEQKGIDFIYLPAPELPQSIQADEKRLRQVLINLQGNAIKFTDKGRVTFKVDVIANGSLLMVNGQQQLAISNQQLPISKIRFAIEDTGVGISSETLDKIFMPFEQVGEQKRQAEGTGLGLAISNQIVNMMGSSIQVQSQLGVGSVFSFEVDLPLVTDWIQSATKGRRETIIGYQGQQKTILVVDDKWENRSVIVNLLKPIGFVMQEAENGQEGLTLATQIKPDLIITDLSMPVMSGFEMLRHLRSTEELKNLRIIVSSASVYEMDRQESLDSGGDDFLPKPVQAEELFQMLEKHLKIAWEYEQIETAVEATTTATLAPTEIPNSEIVALAPEDLAILLDLAQQGRMKKLIEEAKRIEQSSSADALFIQQIIQFAKSFQAEEIENLIRKYLN